MAQADFASRRRWAAGSDGARVDLALAGVFSTVGFPLAFGFAGAAGAIAARAVCFSSDLAGRVRFVVVGPALRAAFSVTAPFAFVFVVTGGFARRSASMALATLAGLAASGFAGLVVFAVGFVVDCAPLPAVDLVGGLALATLATLDALFGVALMADSPVSVRGDFADFVTFAPFSPEGAVDFADALVRVVVAGDVSHRVACCASMLCAFFAVAGRFIVGVTERAVTAGSVAFFAATDFAVLVTFGFIAGAVVILGFSG